MFSYLSRAKQGYMPIPDDIAVAPKNSSGSQEVPSSDRDSSIVSIFPKTEKQVLAAIENYEQRMKQQQTAVSLKKNVKAASFSVCPKSYQQSAGRF